MPPLYFADMAINHRKQLLARLDETLHGSHWCPSELPSIDKETFGQKLSDDVFQAKFMGDLGVYFKALLNSREGELLQLPGGSWVTIDEQTLPRLLCRDCWHVQYARTREQRQAEGPTRRALLKAERAAGPRRAA